MTGAWLPDAVSQSPSPFIQPPAPEISVPELVIGGILAAFGVRSLVKWMRMEFEAESLRDHALYLIHAAARVGLWFAFAGFFIGLALVDEPARFIRWYVFVPIGLAGVQLMTAVFLGRSPVSRPRSDEQNSSTSQRVSGGSEGNRSPMGNAKRQPAGPLEPDKHGETADPGHPQPEAAEVESAQLLANQARNELRRAGLTDRDIRRLADEYIALDRGEDLGAFIAWAKERARA